LWPSVCLPRSQGRSVEREIEKLPRTLHGARSERKERIIDQLKMQVEDAEADATEDELAAERSASSTLVKSFERKRPARKPFPEHLPRERVVIARAANRRSFQSSART
jgi:transposase